MENNRTRILVPTAGAPPAKVTAEYIVRIARRLNADVVVLHVYQGSHPTPDARASFDVFVDAAVALGVSVQSRIQGGEVVDTIVSVGKSGDYALVIMGASPGVDVKEWTSSMVLQASELPVVVIPQATPTKGDTG